MSRFHLVCFFFVFKEVHLYRAQLHTPTGFLHFYRGETGTRWVQYGTNKLVGIHCGAARPDLRSISELEVAGEQRNIQTDGLQASELSSDSDEPLWIDTSVPAVVVGGVRGHEPKTPVPPVFDPHRHTRDVQSIEEWSEPSPGLYTQHFNNLWLTVNIDICLALNQVKYQNYMQFT